MFNEESNLRFKVHEMFENVDLQWGVDGNGIKKFNKKTTDI